MLDLINSRKSVRTYSDKEISNDDLRKILEAGRLAPSWMNVQCWKFVVVKEKQNKELLCELAIGQAHVRNAKALIVCVADTEDWEKANIAKIQNQALNPALQNENGILIRSLEQLIFPVSYMMLEAESLGISSCIIGAFGSEITNIQQETYKKVKEQLGLNDKQIISTIITLGYESTKQPTNKNRKDFNEVVSLERIGNPLQ